SAYCQSRLNGNANGEVEVAPPSFRGPGVALLSGRFCAVFSCNVAAKVYWRLAIVKGKRNSHNAAMGKLRNRSPRCLCVFCASAVKKSSIRINYNYTQNSAALTCHRVQGPENRHQNQDNQN